MTENALQFEVSQKQPYKVRGTRKGLLFRFYLAEEPDAQKQSAIASAAIMEKVPSLAQLLSEGAVIEIEGAQLGELDRLRLEQNLSAQIGVQIHMAVCAECKKIQTKKARTYIGTVRGGMHIKADGDLTVVGDVHAGARLEAGGSVVVLGVLSGAVWAGQSGDAQAIAAAWKLKPTEIRIADVYGQKPCDSYAPCEVPECAYLREGEILIKYYSDRM